MLRKMKKIGILGGIILCVIGIATGTTGLNAKADINVIAPLYESIATAKVSLNISGSTATVKTYVEAKEKETIKIKMHLKKKEGDSWKIVKTWTGTTVDNSLTLRKTYTVSSGTYKVYSIITVDGEEIVRSSTTMTK